MRCTTRKPEKPLPHDGECVEDRKKRDTVSKRFAVHHIQFTLRARSLTAYSPGETVGRPPLKPQNTPPKRVIVVGGGVAGLSAAHELAERGFDVHVYERKSVFGGKARSVAFSPEKDVSLPAEHGFRFFPGFYKHVIETMSRIPCGAPSNRSVADNLVTVSELVALGNVPEDPVLGVLPLQPLWSAFGDWVAFLPSFLDVTRRGSDGKPLTGSDLAFFASRIWAFWMTCDQRREAELEKMSWSEFVGSSRSIVYEKYLSVGLTRNLVACKAEKASAFTVGTIGFQLIKDAASGLFKTSGFDRVLNGPTSAVWIDPWVKYLQSRGVTFHAERELTGIDLVGGTAEPRIARVHFARAADPAGARPGGSTAVAVDAEARALAAMAPGAAHEDLAARPAEDASVRGGRLLRIRRAGRANGHVHHSCDQRGRAELGGAARSATSVQWMNGVLFYMTRKNDLPTAHTDYLDSDWALTSIDQGEALWPDWLRMRGTDTAIEQIVSVDVSDWTALRTNGKHYGKSASELTRNDVIEETWQQVKQAVAGRAGYALDDAARKYSFVDDDIQDRLNVRKLLTYHRWRRAKGKSEQPLLTNAEPLLVRSRAPAPSGPKRRAPSGTRSSPRTT